MVSRNSGNTITMTISASKRKTNTAWTSNKARTVAKSVIQSPYTFSTCCYLSAFFSNRRISHVAASISISSIHYRFIVYQLHTRSSLGKSGPGWRWCWLQLYHLSCFFLILFIILTAFCFSLSHLHMRWRYLTQDLWVVDSC